MHIMTEKNIKDFLLTVYSEYVDKYGQSYSMLDQHKIPLTYEVKGDRFSEYYDNIRKPLSIFYLKELEVRGWLTKNVEGSNVTFSLTSNGLVQGYILDHPFKYFISVHWKWGVASTIAIIGLLSTFI